MSASVSGMTAVRPTAAQSRKAIYAATIGNVMEWYDFGVFGYLAGSLVLNFFPKDNPAAALLNSNSHWWQNLLIFLLEPFACLRQTMH